MKKSLFFIILLLIMPIVSAKSCNDCYVNSNGVEFTKSQYNAYIEIGFSQEDLDNMSQETYDSHGIIDKIDKKTEEKYFRETEVLVGKKYTIIEEISKYDYENEVPINEQMIISNTGISPFAAGTGDSKVHETTYKKLTGSVIKTSTTEPNKRMVISSLEWKKIPSTFSYDIYASRVSNGVIVLNSQAGSMKQEHYKFNEDCGFNGTTSSTTSYPSSLNTWNTQKSGLGYSGVGFTGKLDTRTAVCTHDYGVVTAPITGLSSTLSYSATTTNNSSKLTAYISYQHAQKSVNFNDVYKAYTFNSNGLGGVVYFSNSNLSSAYDGMAGLTISY